MARIGIFTDHGGGVYVFSSRLASALKAEGTSEIHLFTYRASTPREEAAVDGLTRVSDAVHFISRTEDGASLVDDIRAALRETRCDVFIPNYRYTTYAALAGASKHPPWRPPRSRWASAERPPGVIGMCHDDDASYYELLAHYERIVEVFVCPSPSTKTALEACIPHRRDDVFYLPHGVPVIEDCEPAYEGGPLKLVYVGRLEETQKRVSYLIAIAADLERHFVPFNLALVGDGPDREKYARRVEHLGLSGRIDFCGHREPDEVKEILRTSHVAVSTSMHEGFCFGLAEAMGAGLPAIAFSCGGVIEQYLKDGVNGHVVPWGDTRGAADRIAEFYDNPMKWNDFSAKARKEIRTKYSMAAFGRGYAKLLDERVIPKGRVRSWPAMRPVLPDRNRRTILTDRLGSYAGLW